MYYISKIHASTLVNFSKTYSSYLVFLRLILSLFHLKSFWSPQMMSPGPSALEQLIRQQQQHAGHDKTPP